jgi:hypothetical protein
MLGRDNKSNPTTGITTIGDTVIGDILDQSMILFPLAIDPVGRFGPIFQHFHFDIQLSSPLTFTPTKPNATSMHPGSWQHLGTCIQSAQYWRFGPFLVRVGSQEKVILPSDSWPNTNQSTTFQDFA